MNQNETHKENKKNIKINTNGNDEDANEIQIIVSN